MLHRNKIGKYCVYIYVVVVHLIKTCELMCVHDRVVLNNIWNAVAV